MKKDIANTNDINLLVNAFYDKALKDSTIGYIFTEISTVNLEEHLPVICAFWESILLDKKGYKGNPMLKHIELNRKEALTAVHFDRWIELWEATVWEHFTGKIAEKAVSQAKSIKALMMYKIEQSEMK